MSEDIIKVIIIALIYLIFRNFLFRKSKGKKMSFRKRYEMKKKEKNNDEEN